MTSTTRTAPSASTPHPSTSGTTTRTPSRARDPLLPAVNLRLSLLGLPKVAAATEAGTDASDALVAPILDRQR